MKKVGIFYGSSTGTTAKIARKIADIMGMSQNDVHDVAKTSPSEAGVYEVLLLGSSTWGNGDVQDDWFDFLTGLDALALKGKKIAVFGCGDVTMEDTFCNAVGEIHDKVKTTGAELIGEYNTDGYEFNHSKAVKEDGKAVGLLLDEVNHPELTGPRLHGWVQVLNDNM